MIAGLNLACSGSCRTHLIYTTPAPFSVSFPSQEHLDSIATEKAQQDQGAAARQEALSALDRAKEAAAKARAGYEAARAAVKEAARALRDPPLPVSAAGCACVHCLGAATGQATHMVLPGGQFRGHVVLGDTSPPFLLRLWCVMPAFSGRCTPLHHMLLPALTPGFPPWTYPPIQDAVELTPGPSLVKAKLALTPHSLDRLLSYHDDNTKEAAFEVALFAEMFLEMLQVRGVWGGGGARKGCGAGVCEKACAGHVRGLQQGHVSGMGQGRVRGMEKLHARGLEACGSTSSQMPGNVLYIQW